MRIRKRRILPATWPSTTRSMLSSLTRNIAFGRASTTSPSSSTLSSFGIQSAILVRRAGVSAVPEDDEATSPLALLPSNRPRPQPAQRDRGGGQPVGETPPVVPVLPAPVPVFPAPVPVFPAPVPVLPAPVPVFPAPVPVLPAPVLLPDFFLVGG